MDENRAVWIDAIRGLAMCLVVPGHMAYLYIEYNYALSTGGARFALLIEEGIYMFHMPLLFVLSGYLESLLSSKRRDMHGENRWIEFRTYFVKNFLNLYLVAVIFSYLYIILRITASNMFAVTLEDASFGDLHNLWYQPKLWFLAALFYIRVVNKLLETLPGGQITNIVVWPILCLFALLYTRSGKALPSIGEWTYWGFFYAFGSWIARCRAFTEPKRFTAGILTSGGLIAIGTLIQGNSIDFLHKLLFGCGISFILMYLFFCFCRQAKLLSFCGKNSILIYILDLFLVGTMRTIAVGIGLKAFVPYLVFGSAGVLIICLGSALAIDRVPMLSWINYILYPYRLLLQWKRKKGYCK